VTAGITAFYMFRLYFLTFTGECRAPIGIRSHIREQPTVVVVPLAILAALAIVGGLVGFPDAYGEMIFSLHRSNSLHYFLQESAASAHHEVSRSHEFALAALAVLVSATGIGAAAVLYYYRTDLVPRVTAALRPLYQLVWRKYYVDELYHQTIVRPLVRVSDAFLYRTFDAGVIDRIGVDGTARFVRGIADRGLKLLQTGLTQSYVFVMLVGGLVLVAYLVGGF
jgi:NADH-quinone oxidoreductase subunit L